MTHEASAAGPICPSCGAAASGAFCSQCGAAVAAQCRRCETALPAGARFCPKCGTVAARTATFRPGAGAIASAIAVAALAALGVARWRGEAPSAPPEAAPAAPGSAAPPAGEAAPPPDISSMTPQERFDRLYQRVMTATRTGDAATSQRFMPMALAAYEMLDSASADTRYHAAMLRLHSGDAAAARALGDSIVRNDSTNLLGYVLLGTVARFQRDSATLRRISAAFMRHYDREISRDRPEYTEHRNAISDFRREASGEPPPRTPRAGG